MRIVLIVVGYFALAERKLVAAIALSIVSLLGLGWMVGKHWDALRRNVKALWLAFRVSQVTRELRAAKRRIETSGLRPSERAWLLARTEKQYREMRQRIQGTI